MFFSSPPQISLLFEQNEACETGEVENFIKAIKSLWEAPGTSKN
jgi:hypothetical protein